MRGTRDRRNRGPRHGARHFYGVAAVGLAAMALVIVPWRVAELSAAPQVDADDLRLQLTRERADHAKEVQQLLARERAARRDARRWRQALQYDVPVTTAIRVAATTYGVPASTLQRVAWCESNHRPGVSNGQYQGLFQFGPALWSITPFAGESRYDPVASALAASWAFSRGYASHWECK